MGLGLRSKARGAVRELAKAPLRLVGEGLRAEILDNFSNTMVSRAPIGGMDLRFFAPSPLLQIRAAWVLKKEPDMIRWIDGFSKDDVFWDVGANVGVFSLYAAARIGCRVLAFEPAAANFHVLARNIGLNNLAGQMDGYCVALSGTTSLGKLNLASLEMGAARSQFGAPGEFSPYAEGLQEGMHGMLGFAVDEFIALFDPPFPTCLKIDVDGLELAILRGAEHTLRNPRLRSVMVELSLNNDGVRENGFRLLAATGLRYASRGEAQGATTESAANHLFIRAT